MTRKYELTDGIRSAVGGRTFFRIRALKDFADVKEGDLGGFVENENNLSQEGNCWIYDDAKAIDNACVHMDATVRGTAVVCGDACVTENATVSDRVVLSGHALVSGRARVQDDVDVSRYARIEDDACVSGQVHLLGQVRVCENANVYGHVRLHGDVRLARNADVCEAEDYLTVQSAHIVGDVMTFYRTCDGIWVHADDDYPLERFAQYVKKAYIKSKYGNTELGHAYQHLIEVAKMWIKRKEER